MTPNTLVIVQPRPLYPDGWKPLVKLHSETYNIDPYLISGQICQESSGYQYAFHPEPEFYKKYKAAILKHAAETKDPWDDWWWNNYPFIASAGFGLMQVEYETALELGYVFKSPFELFDPNTNIQVGCHKLDTLITKHKGSIEAGLLAYNGGGDTKYPSRIFDRMKDVQSDKIFD